MLQGVQVSESREFRKYYFRDWHTVSALRQVSEPIICYRGGVGEPRWKDVDSGICLTIHSIVHFLKSIYYSDVLNPLSY